MRSLNRNRNDHRISGDLEEYELSISSRDGPKEDGDGMDDRHRLKRRSSSTIELVVESFCGKRKRRNSDDDGGTMDGGTGEIVHNLGTFGLSDGDDDIEDTESEGDGHDATTMSAHGVQSRDLFIIGPLSDDDEPDLGDLEDPDITVSVGEGGTTTVCK